MLIWLENVAYVDEKEILLWNENDRRKSPKIL